MNGQDILHEWRAIEETKVTSSVFVNLYQWFDELNESGAKQYRVVANNTYRGEVETLYSGAGEFEAKLAYYNTAKLLTKMNNVRE